VGAEKPNKEYFDYVFEKLGITDKKEVLMIGDSLIGDMTGGYNAGIDTCWYNPSHKPNTSGVPITYEIDNLGEIMEIVG
jgi:2-haloacid dehalogenase